jgi:hypothetical protein
MDRKLARLAWWLAIAFAGAVVLLVLRPLAPEAYSCAMADSCFFDIHFFGGAEYLLAGSIAFLIFAACVHARRFFATRNRDAAHG